MELKMPAQLYTTRGIQGLLSVALSTTIAPPLFDIVN